MSRACRIAGVVVAVALTAAGSAQADGRGHATKLRCGAVVTRDTTLANDLRDCPGTALRIGADGVALDLGGHVVDGTNAPGSEGIAVDGRARVKIAHGTIRDFRLNGVGLRDAEDATVRDLGITRIGAGGVEGENVSAGIFAKGSPGLSVVGNRVSNDVEAYQSDGIVVLESDRATIARNDVSRNAWNGIVLVGSERAAVQANRTIENDHTGIFVGESPHVVIRGNTSGGHRSDDAGGIVLFGTSGAVVEENTVFGNLTGIALELDATGNVVRGNTAVRNVEVGIYVAEPGNTLARNTAKRNGVHGIEAPAGTIDGGGNRAAGNGEQQCIGVACAPAAGMATAPGRNGVIAFRRYLGPDRTKGAIFVANPDGTGERQLTTPPEEGGDDYPDVSPDGSFVAFERCQPGCGIWIVNTDGTGLRRVDRGCAPGRLPPRCVESAYPAISPDGREIAFQRAFGRIVGDQIDHQGIYRMRLDGTHVRKVSLPRKRAAEDVQPQWSPDGTRIVFTRFNYGATRPRGGQALFVVNRDGTQRRKLTPWAIRAGDGPDWSPDGTQILFRSPDTEDFLNTNLWTIRTDGTGLRQVTRLPEGTKLYSASFSPDGTAITFGMTGVAGQADVWRMAADGSGMTPVTRTPLWDSAPDWGAAP